MLAGKQLTLRNWKNIIRWGKTKSEKIVIFVEIMIAMKNYKFTAEVIRDNEINQYIGIIPGLPGVRSQASTLDELYKNLQEVVQLCLEELSEEELKELPDFIGFQQISIAV